MADPEIPMETFTARDTELSNLGAYSIDVVREKVRYISDLRFLMKEGEHYGTIPGTKKTTLYKPGAELFAFAFRLIPEFDVTRTVHGEHRAFDVKCRLVHSATALPAGEGLGICSTLESKYRYRSASPNCPKCGAEAIMRDKKGAGWYCWKKYGGCGANFKEDEIRPTGGKVEVENPADFANTALKMAKKRAFVDAVLTATGTSDFFTQDLEDDVPGAAADRQPNRNKSEPPARAAKPAATGSAGHRALAALKEAIKQKKVDGHRVKSQSEEWFNEPPSESMPVKHLEDLRHWVLADCPEPMQGADKDA